MALAGLFGIYLAVQLAQYEAAQALTLSAHDEGHRKRCFVVRIRWLSQRGIVVRQQQ